jgi:hypothetical protein
VKVVHGLELLEYVPAQLLKAFPVVAVAVSVGVEPHRKLPEEHPTEFAGEAVAEAPPEPYASVRGKQVDMMM